MSAEDGVGGKDFYGTSFIAPIGLGLRRNPFIFLALIEQLGVDFQVEKIKIPLKD